MVVKKNGEVKALSQDALALLKILALGSEQVERGETTPLATVVSRLRSKK